MKSPVLASLLVSVCVFLCQPRSLGLVTVDFIGGEGSPLSFTLPEVTFVVTNAVSLSNPLILVVETNLVPSWSSGVVTPTDNTLLWSTANPEIVFLDNSGYNFYANAGLGHPLAGQTSWFGLPFTGTWTNGNTLTFAGGTLGGTATPPETYVDGLYNLTLRNVGGDVVASLVPEPSIVAVLAGSLVFFGILFTRRGRVAGNS